MDSQLRQTVSKSCRNEEPMVLDGHEGKDGRYDEATNRKCLPHTSTEQHSPSTEHGPREIWQQNIGAARMIGRNGHLK